MCAAIADKMRRAKPGKRSETGGVEAVDGRGEGRGEGGGGEGGERGGGQDREDRSKGDMRDGGEGGGVGCGMEYTPSSSSETSVSSSFSLSSLCLLPDAFPFLPPLPAFSEGGGAAAAGLLHLKSGGACGSTSAFAAAAPLTPLADLPPGPFGGISAPLLCSRSATQKSRGPPGTRPSGCGRKL